MSEHSLVILAQGFGVALLVFAGQWVVARLSKKATDKSTTVDSQGRATEAWERYAQKMEQRLQTVEQRLSEAERREEETRRRIDSLERQADRDKDLIRRLVGRLRRALEQVRALGGQVSDDDLEVLDLSHARLELETGD